MSAAIISASSSLQIVREETDTYLPKELNSLFQSPNPRPSKFQLEPFQKPFDPSQLIGSNTPFFAVLVHFLC
jgi:hypothetical protein